MIDIREDPQARSCVRVNVERCKNALNLIELDVRAAEIEWDGAPCSSPAELVRYAETARNYLTEIITTIKG